MSYFLAWLPGIQIGLSVALIICVLLQSRGAAVGSAFGGSGTIYRTKRGLEKGLFRATIILAIAFSIISIMRITLP